jgi:hypothetical protein
MYVAITRTSRAVSYPILSYTIPFIPKRTGEDRVLYTLLDKLFYFLSNAVTFLNSVFSLTISHLSVDKVTAPLRHIDDGLTKD